jgi:tripartite-type tricarboxylate transporter receptor subunit TctC
MKTFVGAYKICVSLAILAASLIAAGPAGAQTYPSASIKFVVPYPAGGAGDMVARLIGERLAAVLGTSVVVLNRPGAGGTIGAMAVVNSPPDGYTLLVGHAGEIAINRHWGQEGNYDPDTDLVPVALAAVMPLALVVPGKAPYGTVAEMLNDSKGSARGLSYASSGTTSPSYFAGEMLKFKGRSNLTHIPYAGAAPALNDLLGGHVDLYFSGHVPALRHIRTGALKLLAFSSGKRSALAPDVPTVAEASGIDNFDITIWMGFFLPRGTPATIATRLNAEINKILTEPDMKRRLAEHGADASPMSADQFSAFVKAESEKYRDIIKNANLTPPRPPKKD